MELDLSTDWISNPGVKGGGIVALVFMTCFILPTTGSLKDGVSGSLPPWIEFTIDEKVLLSFTSVFPC